ncbi:glycosyltransferase family 9 protein [Nocardia cyriacigeorgica]|uniref:glycosyltransferase family 9 protein n=1 Tax=Nocardia cyriacigeorgica TaxID=135487 RepID=UPI00189499DC|nr:glycosyltransferase family 9 protein [Nocardia cyriacigeorgica]MBF6454531.1 glycosyltransferase family 9 protein [Nocardia cyriacigeorgica]MBF6482047.1 glycosyltransferase family 9 protein [Nocardia cyriacigeorgica]MBF6552425.1 glycosyltransferase family 9 protein [Nocardia cyriacigeorgica]
MSVVLVLRALGLGDLLTAVPALRALRHARPGDRLVLAAPRWLRPIVELTGTVDALHPVSGLGALRWSGPSPATAVNLHGRGPASIADLAAIAPERLITFGHRDFPQFPGPDWLDDTHEVTRWCGLLDWAGIPADPTRLSVAAPPATAADPARVLIHPGGSSAARRWPAERFARVAAHLHGRGYRVLITGDARERTLAAQVAAEAGAGTVVAGRLALDETAALVAGARLVVCADTGLAHLATAFGTPSVVIFGPNPPRWWGPPPRSRHRALWAGRIGDPHASTPDPGLLMIGTDDVIEAVDDQLALAWSPRARTDAMSTVSDRAF